MNRTVLTEDLAPPGARASGRTLALELPASCDEPAKATEKWLLSLWEASRKSTWLLWRDRAAISLEYVADLGKVWYQCHFTDALLADVTRAVLPVHCAGMEIAERDGLPTRPPGDSTGRFVTFQMRSPGWVELPKDAAPEGVGGIVGALGSLGSNQSAIVQILLSPTWMTTEDGRRPAFWLAGRVATLAGDGNTADRLARRIAAAFGQFTGFNGLRFSTSTLLRDRDARSIADRRWIRRTLPPGPAVTVAQAGLLFHPPERAAAFPYLCTVLYRRTSITPIAEGISIGEGRDDLGFPCPVRLRPQDLLRHAFVVGPSGSGKSTFLSRVAHELIAAGHGVTVIDPHGTLVSSIARTLPPARAGAASLLRFADADHPVSLNPFRAQPGYEFLAADEVVEIVQKVYGREYWGPLLDLLLRHAAIATIELGGSVVEAARLLEDPWFRERALNQLRNPETIRFLAQLSGDAIYDRRLLPAIQRLQRLLASPWLRNILGQTEGQLDLAEAFRRREVLLMDLSGVGMSNSRLLGSLLLLMVRQATLNRPATGGDSVPLQFLLIDEASWFISRTVAELFDQARKFGVGMILATQRLGQLGSEDTREAVLANAGSLVTFRITDREEAAYLARHLASDTVGPSDLQHLPRFEAYAQLTRDDERLHPSWLRTPPPTPEPAEGRQMEARLLEAGRQRYARPREEVESSLRDRESALLEDEEPEIRAVAPATLALSAHTARPAHP